MAIFKKKKRLDTETEVINEINGVQVVKEPKKQYYNWDRVLGYNAQFHFIITARGKGKTYGFIRHRLTDFFFNKKKTIFLTKRVKDAQGETVGRSYANVLKAALTDMLTNDEKLHKKGMNMETCEITVKGRIVFLNDEPMFGAYAIGEAEKMKPDASLKTYDVLAHDEVLTLGSYKSNEIEMLNIWFDTIDRDRNTTKLYLLGNPMSRYNPYMKGYNLPRNLNGIFFDKERDFYVEIATDDQAYAEYRQEHTAIGRLVGKDSDYANMAFEGQFAYDNTADVIEELTPENHILSLNYKDNLHTLSWVKYRGRKIMYLHDFNKTNTIVHLKYPNNFPQSKLLDVKNVQVLKDFYQRGLLIFSNREIREQFIHQVLGWHIVGGKEDNG